MHDRLLYRTTQPRGASRMLVLLAVVTCMVLVSLGDSVDASHSTFSATSASGTASVLPHPARVPAALPPVRVHPLGLTGPAAVNPTAIYRSEPAPMGIGDFGIGTGGNPYSYNTTEFLGNFSWQTLQFQNGGDTSFSVQLNVVLQFVQSGVTYAYWIQDVAFMDSANNALSFEDNIWNFTSTCLDRSAVVGNGTVYPYSGCEGYYAVSATVQPGANVLMPNPGDFGLLVRSYWNSIRGVPEVAFEYWDGVTSYYVTYDSVVWPWARAVSADHDFLVDGFGYVPVGIFYDAELTIGGPGGGSGTISGGSTNIASRLLYWNGHNFEAPPAVWNFGSDTAEAVSNLQSIFSHDRAGLPLTVQLNGTAQNATPALAYGQDRVGRLAISAPGISQGTVAIPGDNWAFVGDSANLTLTPGTDLGQSVTFRASLLAPGSGGDTYAWHTSPAGLGCSPSTNLTLSCTPTVTGSYLVNVTVTDNTSHSNTGGPIGFLVSSDPTVGTPSTGRTEVETGTRVTFTASPSGGATPYAYLWSGLPTPCTQTGTSTPVCTPATTGSYSVSVTVTDANAFVVTSPGLAFSVVPGPAITALTATPAGSIDLRQLVTFSTNVSGGSGGYTFAWSGLPAGCSSPSVATFSCSPSAVGVSTVHVAVVDSQGGAATSGPLFFTVHTDPSVGSLAASPPTVDLGQTFHFALNGTPTGGAGSYRYVWSGLPTGCTTNDSPTLACTPSASGSGTVDLTVYDADNGSNYTSTPFAVFGDLSLAGLSLSPNSADVGQSVTFFANGVTGGTGTYVYRWSGLPAGCLASDTPSIVCVPTTVGSSQVSLNVTDSNGLSVEGGATFTVYAAPTVGVPTSTPGSVHVGQSVTFSVSTSGGSGGDTYAWSGLPPGCASVDAPTVTCQPSGQGTFQVTVNVTDSIGVRVQSGGLAFTVVPTPATFLGLPALEGYAVVGLIVALAIVGIVVGASRSRRRQVPPSG